jgi:chromosomal replication initiation ATPase DnaA
VQTTLTIDEDVANVLKKEVRRSGEPLKQAVNRLLHSGLAREGPTRRVIRTGVQDFLRQVVGVEGGEFAA